MSAYVYHYKIWRNRIIPLVITSFCFKMNKPNDWVIILLLLQIGDAWIREASIFASRVCYAVKKRDVICKFKVVCFHSNTLRSQQADDFLVLTERSSTLQLHVFPLTWSLQTSVEWHETLQLDHSRWPAFLELNSTWLKASATYWRRTIVHRCRGTSACSLFQASREPRYPFA